MLSFAILCVGLRIGLIEAAHSAIVFFFFVLVLLPANERDDDNVVVNMCSWFIVLTGATPPPQPPWPIAFTPHVELKHGSTRNLQCIP